MADKRALELANEAIQQLEKEEHDRSATLLREAINLSPENNDVKRALLLLQRSDRVPKLRKLCLNLAVEQDVASSKEALVLLRNPASNIPPDVTKECIMILLNGKGSSAENEEVVYELLRRARGKANIVPELLHNADEAEAIFKGLLALGNSASMDIFAGILTDVSLWKGSERRTEVLREFLKFLIARVPSLKSDKSSTAAVRAASRILVTNLELLETLVNQVLFEFLLDNLRTHDELSVQTEAQSAATLAVAKLLEGKETAKSMLSKFMWGLIADDEDDDLVKAYGTLAAIFPLSPTAASGIFLSEDFLESFMSSLDGRSTDIEAAGLKLLSAAASAPSETGCRKAIKRVCGEFLESILRARDSSSGIAATILAKLGYSAEDAPVVSVEDLSQTFEDLMVKDDEKSQNESLEGLAYSTLKPVVKEKLIADSKFVQNLISTLKRNSSNPTLVYPCLAIIQNLTTYPRAMSEEQKKIQNLKDYANAKKPASPDINESEKKISARCSVLVKAGVVSALAIKKPSESAARLIAEITLSLAKASENRGIMAQQGSPKQLMTIYESTNDFHVRTSAAHALARILISRDPKLVFSASFPSNSAISPLVKILTPPEVDGAQDFLPVFESLMALTNIASSPSESDKQLIIRQGWDRIEDLVLSQNALVQRAAVELICNLMASPYCVEKFADGSKASNNRLNILLVLADADDLHTRLAAGGALAMLLEFEPSCAALLKLTSGVDRLLNILEDEDINMAHRGIACALRFVIVGEDPAKEALKQHGAESKVMAALRRFNSNPQLLEEGVEVLKALKA